MNRTRLTFMLGLLLGAVVLSSSQNVMIFPSREVITVPSLTNALMTGLPLICGLEPDTLDPDVNYTTQWIVPGGQIINSTEGQFIFIESMVSIYSRALPGTILIVTKMSYQDAGMYICEGRSTAPGASTQWASASIELRLNVEVLTDTSTVVATMDDSAIELHCEMRGFIRPDSSLIWEGPDGQRITDGTGKHQITFSDGVPDAAANGSAVLIPSQVSTLNITNPEPSDAGTYTCTVNGTAEAIVINVWVNGSESIDGNMTLADINTTTYGIQAYSTTHPKTTGHAQQLTGIVAGCVTATLTLTEVLLIAAVIMYYLISRRGQSKNNINNATQSSPNPVYYYDYINLELDRSIHHNDQPGVNTAKDDDCMTNVNTTERQNSNHATVMNVEPGTTIDSGIDVAHGVVVDGLSTALEVNMAYGVVDTVMEENEAYGVAIDGVGIDSIERNVAYGAVMINAEYGNDTAREPIHNIMVDSTNV